MARAQGVATARTPLLSSEHEANARLMAAELLEALIHIRDSFWSENESFEDRFDYLQEYARNAIAKAEGKS